MKFRLAFIGIFVLTVAYVSLESGTRLTTLQCVAPAMLVWFFHTIDESLGKRFVKYALIGALLGGLIVLSVYQRLYRTSGVQTLEGDVQIEVDSDFLGETALAVAVQEEEDAYVYEFALDGRRVRASSRVRSGVASQLRKATSSTAFIATASTSKSAVETRSPASSASTI